MCVSVCLSVCVSGGLSEMRAVTADAAPTRRRTGAAPLLRHAKGRGSSGQQTPAAVGPVHLELEASNRTLGMMLISEFQWQQGPVRLSGVG